ncbi:type II toxin-antitoxin system ParD family antitoxin [Paracraurococcus lichenis]|uniref:Type II toxin-antitoxin system ParD family antitoxin n=1 Tax=Paracraurococcus lichenis TaxID=3064888 RepID=A0ABT9DYH6_9PROT|nr:type II toxin-antitoxin system ParD family antitoxin [Paracraurococcus sp. LOR1-02]MDO9708936.1 type II toxin-antitoxin system ParD family antitoxin [Paracraurococcus sp. LOR1-02]
MPSIDLTPEQLRFAGARLAEGRYGSVAEVVAAALANMERQQADLAAFRASLDEAYRRGEEEGWLELEEVMADMDAMRTR